jgi:hypothetical protein
MVSALFFLATCLVYSSTLKIQKVCSSKTSVWTYTQLHGVTFQTTLLFTCSSFWFSPIVSAFFFARLVSICFFYFVLFTFVTFFLASFYCFLVCYIIQNVCFCFPLFCTCLLCLLLLKPPPPPSFSSSSSYYYYYYLFIFHCFSFVLFIFYLLLTSCVFTRHVTLHVESAKLLLLKSRLLACGRAGGRTSSPANEPSQHYSCPVTLANELVAGRNFTLEQGRWTYE